MRRLISLVLGVAVGLALAPSHAQAQTQAWDKLIAPGLTYRMEIDLTKPMVVHALRWTSGSGAIRARAESAKDTVLAPADVDKVRGRDPLTNAIRRTQAIAGINGDFFPMQGSPLGCMLRDGELLALPYPDRSTFGWGPGTAQVSTLTFQGTAKLPSGAVTLKSLNREAGENDLVLQTAFAGYSLSKSPGTHVIFAASGFLRPGVDATGTVRRIEQGKTSVKLGDGEWALTGTDAQITALNKLKEGDQVTVGFSLGGVDLLKIRNIVGGGPGLLRDGRPSLDVVREQFANSFASDRHPRTAIGFNREGDVWLVVVDGRSPTSRGASLGELTDVMIGLGCTDAMNLSGGGDTTLAVLGLVLNHPSDGGEERPLANAVLLFGDASTPAAGDMVVRGTPTLVMGQPSTFTVVDQNGETIPNGEILWAAKGAAWIDQAGTLRPLKPGDVTVYASVRGKVLSVRVNVVDA